MTDTIEPTSGQTSVLLGIEKPDEGEILAKYKWRWQMMRGSRRYFEEDRDTADSQVLADTFYDDKGKLHVNVPLEQNMIELSAGRKAGPVVFNVEPDGNQPNVDELQPARYILDHFLREGDFVREKKQFELDKSKYGTAIFYNGLTYKSNTMYQMKEGTQGDGEFDFWDTKSYDKYVKDSWIFTPQNVPIRNFWIDEKVLRQPHFEKARDCIMQENISIEELRYRRGKNPHFRNIDIVGNSADIDPAYRIQNNTWNNVIIHYYYNRIDKSYWIIANYSIVLFAGKMLYKHGQLPFAVAQHYPSNNTIYGIGIPRKLRYIKLYKSGMLQNALDKVQMSSGINLGIGNNGEVDGELYTAPGQINVRRFTDSLQNVQQYQLDGNIQSLVSILELIDDYVIQDTGENVKAPYASPAGTLGEVEIMEENKAIRVKAVDESRDVAFAKALTQSLNNITQFAPKLLRKEETINGDVKKIIYPMITIPNVEIKKEGGKKTFVENMGKYGYFEFKPDTIKSELRVAITNQSTRSILRTLEKESIKSCIENVMALAKIKPDILQKINTDDMWNWIKMAYSLDDSFNAKTEKDKIKADNLKKLDALKTMIGLPSNPTNENTIVSPQDVQSMNQPPMAGGQPTMGQMPKMPAMGGGAGKMSPMQTAIQGL